jgi:hypothetical protein
LIVGLPRGGRFQHILSHNPIICKKAQEPQLGDAAESDLDTSESLKPMLGLQMMNMLSEANAIQTLTSGKYVIEIKVRKVQRSRMLGGN